MPVQQGARPISASAGQLYGTDGNPVVLKVCPMSWFLRMPRSACFRIFLPVLVTLADIVQIHIAQCCMCPSCATQYNSDFCLVLDL